VDGLSELVATFVSYLPRVIFALAIAGAGFVLAVAARRLTAGLLGRLRFDAACERIGLVRLMSEGGIERTPSQFAGLVVFYAVLLLAILAALGPLGLDFLAETLNQVILYAPRVLVAVLILILGTSAAGLLAELAGRGLVQAGVERTGGFKSFLRFSVILIAAILAATVLGIEVTVLIVLIVIALGGAALAAALALGLGLRGLSQNIAAGRYLSEGIEEGDEISVNGISGTVEQIGYAMTKVRSPDGRLYLIPNSHFQEHVVEKRERPQGDERA
jgi:small-conductance mechanosensitive channel